ncbi:MAG: pyridoxal-phosphate dependent enzyme, partial [Thermomicrobiales bacterium]|nr:pyridoxal-phosphate dependent enzyme [Thermomicrobiales bacterium]
TDDELLDGMRTLARLEGLFASPESGAAVAAARKLRESGFLAPEDRTVIFSTGSGLMHVDLIPIHPPVIDPNEHDLVAAITEARAHAG